MNLRLTHVFLICGVLLTLRLAAAEKPPAHFVIGQSFGDFHLTRADLLAQVREFEKSSSDAKVVSAAKQLAEGLESLLKEEQEQPLLSDEALEKLAPAERAKELVRKLRNEKDEKQRPSALEIELEKMGVVAVPALISAVDDHRPTRNFSSSGRMIDWGVTEPPRLRSIGEYAVSILMRISGRAIAKQGYSVNYSAWAPVFASSPTEPSVVRRDIEQWWAEYQRKGERQSLIDDVENLGPGWTTELRWLIQRYPADAGAAIVKAYAWTNSKGKQIYLSEKIFLLRILGECKYHGCNALLREKLENGETLGVKEAAASSLRELGEEELLKGWDEIREKTLRADLKDGKTVAIRMAAARELGKLGRLDVVPVAIQEWRQLPKHNRNGLDEGFETLVNFLCASGEARAMQALVADWDRRDTYGRFEIVRKLGEWLATGVAARRARPTDELIAKPPEPASTQAAVALLAHALEVTDVRSGMAWGSFANPRICDGALWALHQIEPKVYAFSEKAGRRQRDVERFTAANVWRKANAKPLLPVPVTTLPALPPEGALKITEVEITPGDVKPEIAARLAKLENGMFAAKTISDILNWFATNQTARVGGVSVDATREDDLRGVKLSVKVIHGDYRKSTNRMWQTHHSVSVGGKGGGAGSGSCVPDSLHDYWTDFDGKVRKAMESPPNTSFIISAGWRS